MPGAEPPGPLQNTYGASNQMTYIDKSDLHAFGNDSSNKASGNSEKAEPAKKKVKNPYEKQQIVMSEAVMEGKGDKDDSDINLPVDFNDSSTSNNTSAGANIPD